VIRIVVQTADGHQASHVGGPVDVSWKTFDIECPELEAFLGCRVYPGHRQVVGAEVIPEPERVSANTVRPKTPAA
jgi:hypothetical protein